MPDQVRITQAIQLRASVTSFYIVFRRSRSFFYVQNPFFLIQYFFDLNIVFYVQFSHSTFNIFIFPFQQSCPSSRQQQRFGFAYFLCKQSGDWSASVNASQCAYTSETTETLHKFASMNTSFDTVTLLESAKHFLNFTGNPSVFTVRLSEISNDNKLNVKVNSFTVSK